MAEDIPSWDLLEEGLSLEQGNDVSVEHQQGMMGAHAPHVDAPLIADEFNVGECSHSSLATAAARKRGRVQEGEPALSSSKKKGKGRASSTVGAQGGESPTSPPKKKGPGRGSAAAAFAKRPAREEPRLKVKWPDDKSKTRPPPSGLKKQISQVYKYTHESDENDKDFLKNGTSIFVIPWEEIRPCIDCSKKIFTEDFWQDRFSKGPNSKSAPLSSVHILKRPRM